MMEQKQKTVAIITPYFPPQGGGLERYAFEIAKRLHDEYKWRVVVISSGEKNGKDKKEEVNGLTVYRLRYGLKFSNTPFSFGWFFKIRKILKNEKPDIVNIHTPVPGIGDIASLLARQIPQVVTYHMSSMRKGNFLIDFFILTYESMILRFMLSRAVFLVCSSDFVRFGFLKKQTSKSATITPGVDCDVFISNLSIKTENPVILFVAGMDKGQEQKGLKTLLGAIKILKKEIPGIRLIVVGDGDLRKDYESYASKIGLKDCVNFKGKLEGKKLVETYQSSNVFALPTENDSHPLVILEAMACGLPVVSTKIGGIPAMVEHGKEGFLIQPRDPKALADKINEILSNAEMAKSFSLAARKRAEREFSWHSRVREYDRILRRALEEKTTSKSRDSK